VEPVQAVSDGQLVSYIGTYTDLHGPATVTGANPDYQDVSRDGWRYSLTTQNGQFLSHVRRQSFAVVTL
jgi:hypothetical protein